MNVGVPPDEVIDVFGKFLIPCCRKVAEKKRGDAIWAGSFAFFPFGVGNHFLGSNKRWFQNMSGCLGDKVNY
jgi:hypothetical protein